MDIRSASNLLLKRLEQNLWFQHLAISNSEIFIFLKKATNSKELSKFKQDGWMGFPVKVEVVGKIKPLNKRKK